jgi:predicted acyltransferase
MPGGPMYGASGPPKADGSAIASLVCGIVGLFCFIPAIVAIVLGASSKRRIDQSNGQLTGGGMATAGLVLGIVGVALGVIYVVVRASN